MFDRMSKSALRIRAFALVMSAAMMLVQLLAMLMMPMVTGGPFYVDGFFELMLATVYSIVIGQVVLTYFLRHGIENAGAWLAAFVGFIVYGLFDTGVSAWIEHKNLLPLSRAALIFTIRMTANVLWMYGIWLGVTLFLVSQQKVAEERQRSLMLERAQFQTRLAFLESQINPHFLFNALNTVTSLIVLERPGDARDALVHLGHLLRRSLNGEGRPMATLQDEIDAAQAYLSIEKLRFADRLHIDWSIDPQLRQISLPRFSLQPLVENVVKHAVARTTRPVRARIRAERLPSGEAQVSVWNDGLQPAAAATQKGAGVALENLRQRIELLYAGEGSLAAGRPAEDAFECRIVLPMAAALEAAA